MLSDGGGLYLQVTKDGHRSWIFRYVGFKYERDGSLKLEADGSHKRGPKDHGLGSLRDVSLASARVLAGDCRDLVSRGGDPIEERRAARQRALIEAAQVETFKECAERCIDSRREGWRNPKTPAQWQASLETCAYPVIGALPIQAVAVNHVMQILEPIWYRKPETASRVRGRIENILDWATALNLRTGENPALWRGRLDKLLKPRKRVKAVQHHPALPYAEVGAFMASLRAQEGMAAQALQLLILTATRTNEVLGAKWDEIDFKAEAWTIPADRMKGGLEHRIPLSRAALAILEKLKEAKTGDFVFPGAKPKKPLSNMAMLKLLERMKRDDLTAHGFRSTFRDWAAEQTSYPRELAEKALAHTVRDKVEAAYQRGDLFEKRRRLMNDWAKYCATVKSKRGGNVVAIGR